MKKGRDNVRRCLSSQKLPTHPKPSQAGLHELAGALKQRLPMGAALGAARKMAALCAAAIKVANGHEFCIAVEPAQRHTRPAPSPLYPANVQS